MSQVSGDVTVIGGGWSVRHVDLERLPGTIIAVNDSARLAPRWDYALSMDRLWTENRIDWLREHHEKNPETAVWLRQSAVQNLPEVARYPWVKVFRCDNGTNTFSENPDQLNGMNSGACALNLAWRLQPRRLFLLGFDMNRAENGAAYWYPPYPWSTRAGGTSNRKYSTWAGQFDVARADFAAIDCEVFNVSPTSEIRSFRRITSAEFLELQK